MKSLLKVSIVVLSCAVLFGCGKSSSNNNVTNHSIHGHQKTDAEAIYSVNKNDLNITFTSGESGEEDFDTWQKVMDILPNESLKKHVAEYHVFSDGEDDNLAYVTNMDNDDSKWIFAVDYEDASNLDPEYVQEFVATIIHEFSHIISLEVGEVDRDYTSCTTYEVDEGCTKNTSYLNMFYQQFWQDEVYSNYQNSLQGLNENAKENAIANFYEYHTDEFVNEYSATNPVEDFAESFAFFVLSDSVTSPTTLKAEKLAFFYDFPELVTIRDHVRGRTDARK